ncbi:MAG TPA: AAA family ATPase [Thermoanaerobaculia bacterium]|nr:AAA family ATPase [Thermoanaerobaculia bacterium]
MDINVPGAPAVRLAERRAPRAERLRAERLRPRNYILTGTPGAGKTTLIGHLRDHGHAVVEESFMSVWRRLRAEGCADPLADESFIDRVVQLQSEREQAARLCEAPCRYFDRSFLCTLALSDFMGRPASRLLLREIERAQAEAIFARDVFFIRDLGYVPGNEVGTMTYEDALAFAEVHRRVYAAHGYNCIDIPALPVEARVRLILEHSERGARQE